jgi:cyclopropane fatty-acyl-phospholipid synthase-like methyltransferase
MPYIEQFHRIKSGSKILEVGCGEGGNLLPFAQRGCEVVGIEQQKEIFYLQHNKK